MKTLKIVIVNSLEFVALKFTQWFTYSIVLHASVDIDLNNKKYRYYPRKTCINTSDVHNLVNTLCFCCL